MRSFIGFCSYYRHFIKDFAGIAKPLHQITKKNSRFTWNPEGLNAFEKLKEALIDISVLKHPDNNSPFIVDTDASDNSLGAVLSNIFDGVEYPVVLASRVLTPAECRYSTTKREALAVIQAMKWFKPYNWGTKFVLRTDHASLQWLFIQNNDGILFRMLQRLQEFDFQVVHRPGDKHGNADGLSRQCNITPELTEAERLVMFGSCSSANSLDNALWRINLATAQDANEPISIQFQEDVNSLRLAQRNDPCFLLILQWANAEKHPDQNPLRDLKIKKANAIAQGEDAVAMWGLWDQMKMTDDVLYRNKACGRNQYKPKTTCSTAGTQRDSFGTPSRFKTHWRPFCFSKDLGQARQRFWWSNMRKDNERKCENCTLCQTRSIAGKKRIAPLQTINVGIQFNRVAADILGPVTRAKTSGAKYILVLTDYFTKYVVCVPLERITSEDVIRAIVENCVLTFGAPDCLHTDQKEGANFCSELLLEVCKIFGREKTRTSPYHPQGNGVVEGHNRVVADVISEYYANNPSSWDQMIPYLNFVYNTTVHKTTRQTPLSLVFGQDCKYPIDMLLPKAPGHEIVKDEFTRWLNEQFREAHTSARETLG